MQIELTTPKQKGALIFFYGDERRFREIDYRFDLSVEDRRRMLEVGIRQDRIVDVLRYLRSNSKYQYSTLDINGFTGTLAPPRTYPPRWCYGNDEAVEWEFFWEWHPSEEAKALMLSSIIQNYLTPKKPHPIFKELIPYRYDRGIQIDPIPIYQLAGMVHPNATWLFSSEDKDEC